MKAYWYIKPRTLNGKEVDSYTDNFWNLGTKPYKDWKEFWIELGKLSDKKRHCIHSLVWHRINRRDWQKFSYTVDEHNYWLLLECVLYATEKKFDEDRCKSYWKHFFNDWWASL